MVGHHVCYQRLWHKGCFQGLTKCCSLMFEFRTLKEYMFSILWHNATRKAFSTLFIAKKVPSKYLWHMVIGFIRFALQSIYLRIESIDPSGYLWHRWRFRCPSIFFKSPCCSGTYLLISYRHFLSSISTSKSIIHSHKSVVLVVTSNIVVKYLLLGSLNLILAQEGTDFM